MSPRTGRITVGIVSLVALFAFLAATVAAPAQRPDPPPYAADGALLQRAHASRMVGAETADVVIDEYIDFACPDCRDFNRQRGDELHALVEQGNLRLVYRFYPLPKLMRGYQAAEAALCAGGLDGPRGFQEMRTLLFENQESWRYELDPTPRFLDYAQRLELPVDRFRSCLERDAMAPIVITDVRLAGLGGVRGTPTFLFNAGDGYSGEVSFYGNEPISRFRSAIERVRSGDGGDGDGIRP